MSDAEQPLKRGEGVMSCLPLFRNVAAAVTKLLRRNGSPMAIFLAAIVFVECRSTRARAFDWRRIRKIGAVRVA